MSTAEQIIAEHRWSALTDACKCGDPTITWGAHPAHVVAALTNAGQAIVELPGKPDEEMPENDDEHGYSVWHHGLGSATAHTDGSVTVDSGYHFSVHPTDARRFAGALLAAARVAEGGEQP